MLVGHHWHSHSLALVKMKQMVYNHSKAAGMETLQCWRAGPTPRLPTHRAQVVGAPLDTRRAHPP
jgi:hypothetical protein